MRRTRSWPVAVGLTLLLALVAAACSSNDETTSTPTATAGSSEDESKAPEEARAPAAEVTAGLTQIRAMTAKIAAAVGSAKGQAEELNKQIEPLWQGIEGTVKANDADAYISFEDSFAELEKAIDNGDSAKAQQAATTVATTVTAYLGKYPG